MNIAKLIKTSFNRSMAAGLASLLSLPGAATITISTATVAVLTKPAEVRALPVVRSTARRTARRTTRRITTLPVGYRRVMVGGAPYYMAGGVYYQSDGAGYVEVNIY